MTLEKSADGITTSGPIWSIALKCCDPPLIRHLTDASRKYCDFAFVTAPPHPFDRSDSAIALMSLIFGAGAFVQPAPIRHHIEAVQKVEVDFKQRIGSGEVVITGVEWEPRRTEHRVPLSREWAEALSFDWARNTARLEKVLYINLICTIRSMPGIGRSLQTIEFRSAPKKTVLLDGEIQLTGRAAEILAVLWPAFKAYRDRRPSTEELMYMNALDLGDAVGLHGPSLYKLITRTRAEINKQFQRFSGVSLAKNGLLQTSHRHGYRINPALEIVQADQPSVPVRVNRTPGGPTKRDKLK